MTDHAAESILAEFARWTWTPPGATVVETDGMRLFLIGDVATLLDAPTDDVTSMVARVRTAAAEHGASTVEWTVPPGCHPADLPEALRALGAEVADRLDYAAYDLTRGTPDIPVPADVDAHPVRTTDDVRAALWTAYAVWGGDEPTEADVDQRFARLEAGWFVGFHAGRPAGSGGYTLAGAVARMWGTGVVAHLRGRGVYRALVAARLRDARDRGAELALVRAKADTSAPILRRLGFGVLGQGHVFRVPTRT